MPIYLGKKRPSASDSQERSVLNKKKLNRQMLAVSQNIVFTKTSRWAYYRIPVEPFDFLPREEQYHLGRAVNNGLVNLMGDRQRPLKIHIMGDSIPVNIDAWREQTVRAVEAKKEALGDGSRIDSNFFARQTAYLEYSEFSRKVVLLGIEIGKRTDVVDDEDANIIVKTLKNAQSEIMTNINQFMGNAVQGVSAEEEALAKKEEEHFFNIISMGNLRGERSDQEEILLLTKKAFYPFMPVPYLDTLYDERIDEGDIVAELASDIREHGKFLKIRQTVGDDEMVGYRSVMSMRKFPRLGNYPVSTPFLYALNSLGYPFPFYARVTMHPSESMRRLIDKKVLESKDELKNIEEGDVGQLPEEVSESIHDMENIKSITQKTSEPWIEGSYRIVVEADNLKKLNRLRSRLRQQYHDMNIVLHESNGDQIQFLLEQMPGDTLRIDSYNQVTTVGHLASSGFNFATEFGDDVMPIGRGGR